MGGIRDAMELRNRMVHCSIAMVPAVADRRNHARRCAQTPARVYKRPCPDTLGIPSKGSSYGGFAAARDAIVTYWQLPRSRRHTKHRARETFAVRRSLLARSCFAGVLKAALILQGGRDSLEPGSDRNAPSRIHRYVRHGPLRTNSPSSKPAHACAASLAPPRNCISPSQPSPRRSGIDRNGWTPRSSSRSAKRSTFRYGPRTYAHCQEIFRTLESLATCSLTARR